MKRLIAGLFAAWAVAIAVAGPLSAQQQAQPAEPVQPPPHVSPWPTLGTGASEGMRAASMALGPELQRGRSAREMLAEKRKLDRALDALAPQRQGVVDAYVIAIALDSDPVFAREAREAGRVLARRYNADGRTVVLAGPDGRSADLPRGSISALTLALARAAELMDGEEDVLVLYSTSHGMDQGLTYHFGDTGYGVLSPYRLGSILQELGIRRRIVMISACYSGVFVPWLASADTAIVTAASSTNTSFGCAAENDWTFFGDALVNNALRKPVPLQSAAEEARRMVAGWEAQVGLKPSEPQISVGTSVAGWLGALEAKIPRQASAPVGMPTTQNLARLQAMMAGGR